MDEYRPGPLPALQPLALDWLAQAAVQVAVLRLDRLDPELSGNKWFKLQHHLRAACEARKQGLISLGGAHSNHLHALAAAGRRFGLGTVGLLRGEACLTPTVRDLQDAGMQLHWLGYGGYRARNAPGFWTPWLERYPQYYPVPEGGGGLPGALGCAGLVAQLPALLPALGWSDYDGCWLAAGTGTTLAGLVLGEAGRHPVYGALAGPPAHGVAENIARLLDEAGVANGGYRLFEACRGGFGRFDTQLLAFIRQVERQCALPVEPVYTGKALLALREAVHSQVFPAGTRLLFVHTGGLQGLRALESQPCNA
ncbi:1-aminocyclopropane-1-carboxylate deaminase [Stutzerimonas kirkiae]|uniref:1-aminocyclopropane-1-carboxylate deaminase n=1 Tax=Stutzerimonas kirkiae TaxID=2211392 RepID=A0A4Q9R9U7_9GAMM|nr:pyridoxal-phosphate dependent enzyme [Stutzerimonas kirkiae]TBU96902.1 1-aminocyclopropane-1-carboxylate deaminase [Stutzerimonas kirkiae]TBV00544.1 1-aminocyclopropane-1-carboxylate deaminase [Stutzerimonas kirkiae]